MVIVTAGRENSIPIELYCEEDGNGPAAVRLHDWLLRSRSSEPRPGH